MTKRLRRNHVGLALFVGALLPFRTTVTPAWRFIVVDGRGGAMPGVSVTQHWQQYTVESSGHRESRVSDMRGVVEFPARFKWTSVALLVGGAARNVFTLGVHASFGPSTFVIARGDHCMGAEANDFRGQPGPILVMRPESWCP